jgi:nicotinamide mononucleotide (NMN) deamidase PncC
MFPPVISDLARSIGSILRDRNETISVAEGSAGGLISASILSVPGASAYYLGGSVIYTARAKRAFLSGEVPEPDGMRGATEGFARFLAESSAARLRTTWAIAEPARLARPTHMVIRLATAGLPSPVLKRRLAKF